MRRIEAFRPRARQQGLLVSRIDCETVVYDLDTHEAHCLNPLASRLWERSDGRTTVAAMQAAESVSEPQVLLGLRLLADAHLLLDSPPKDPGRRRALGRLARAAALPVVLSIVVPTPAAAQSCRPNGIACNANAQCCSGCCKRNGLYAGTCRPPGPPGQCY
ncbi:MAG TPA: hypothetical protein PLD86_06730 [Vicinamibacteria bacterium]|nr:hypothetical protein [Vicinamibacteria bacterium]